MLRQKHTIMRFKICPRTDCTWYHGFSRTCLFQRHDRPELCLLSNKEYNRLKSLDLKGLDKLLGIKYAKVTRKIMVVCEYSPDMSDEELERRATDARN